MPRFKQLLSIALLVAGVVLVFAGLTRSVGFSLAGIAASLAAVVALLYSGAVFFGTYPVPHTITPDTIFVFDRTFRLVAGVHKGLPIRAVLPAGLPGDLDERCTAVFAGKPNVLSTRDRHNRYRPSWRRCGMPTGPCSSGCSC